MDVGRRVANDDHRASLDVESQALARASLRDRRQLRANLVVRPERAHRKAVRGDSRGGQLLLGAGFHVAGQQADDAMRAVHQRIEQLR